jgi:hypothetical protein
VHAAILFARRCRSDAVIIETCRIARKRRRGRRSAHFAILQ